MKEQVSVDKVTYEAFVKFRAECLMRHHEYERLKRLEENVKKKIELIKSTIEKVKDDGLGEFYIDKAILMALESLDK